MLIAAVWLVPRARAGRFRGQEAAIAIGVAVAAVALVGWDRRVNASGSVDWSVAGTAWLLALVALCRGLGVAAARGDAGMNLTRRSSALPSRMLGLRRVVHYTTGIGTPARPPAAVIQAGTTPKAGT